MIKDTKKTPRWQQRFTSYTKAYIKLKHGVARHHYDELAEAGMIQTFAFTFELAWKTLKDLLETEGYEVKSPREAIKIAFQAGYIEEGQIWLEAMEKRNIMAHTYDEDSSKAIIKLIKSHYFPALTQLYNSLQKLI